MSATSKLAGVAVGITMLASAAFGGWKVWSDNPAVVVDPIPVPVVVATQPTNAPADGEKPAAVEVKPAAPVVPLAAKVTEPANTEDVKKARPTGNKHAGQDHLLAQVMQQMHNEAYRTFITRPGFGASRRLPTFNIINREWKIPEWTSEELAKEQPPVKEAKDLSLIHRFSMNQFGSSVLPAVEREKAFVEAIKKAEKKDNTWQIKSLDLVGLVMHDTPKVYVSEKLPEMKDLKKTPVRDLDVFESEGIEELMTGKALYVRAKNDTIRMLGPIHAGKACLKCHGDTKEGDMLGAFSYTLRIAQYEMDGQGFNGRGQPKNSPDFDKLRRDLQPR